MGVRISTVGIDMCCSRRWARGALGSPQFAASLADRIEDVCKATGSMTRHHIIRRLLSIIVALAVGATPALARHHKAAAKTSAHSSSGHKGSSRKSGSHKGSSHKGSSQKSSGRRSGGRHHGSYHAYRHSASRGMAVEALPDLESTAPLDPNDSAGGGTPMVVDTMAQAREAMARNDPAEALGRYLRVLARNPGDLEALLGAGDAALAVGDADAAINFYSRAEKIAPRDGKTKAGLASALVQKEQPRPALKMFDDAVDLGVSPVSIALDRGLAYDLRGDNRRAQQEYALVLRNRVDPEATRRMALSMAMAGDRQGALAVLDPLLRKQDIPAWRARAFVLAMTGAAQEAEQAAYAVLPRTQADALKPFLERLPQLKASEKAAAVHFGHFPENKAPQMADAGAAYGSDRAELPPSRLVTAPVYTPRTNVVTAPLRDPQYSLPPRVAATTPPPPVYQAPVMAPPAVDDTAATAAAEAAQAKADARRKIAEKQQADRKAAAEKAASEKAEKAAERKEKDREEAKAKSKEAERYWVQIASGAYKPDLDKELAKQKAKYGKELAGKSAWTTPYKSTNRLLIGPFASPSAAQDYVNQARKAGLSTVPVTTPAGQKVERLQ
jgi:Flp pilus assembly protein TadD